MRPIPSREDSETVEDHLLEITEDDCCHGYPGSGITKVWNCRMIELVFLYRQKRHRSGMCSIPPLLPPSPHAAHLIFEQIVLSFKPHSNATKSTRSKPPTDLAVFKHPFSKVPSIVGHASAGSVRIPFVCNKYRQKYQKFRGICFAVRKLAHRDTRASLLICGSCSWWQWGLALKERVMNFCTLESI